MNETYESYKKARDAAWRILIKCEIKSLPVDLHQIIDICGFSIHSYSASPLVQLMSDDVKSGDGFITQIGSQKHIYINDKIKSYERRRFTVAHEIGHGCLLHPLDVIHYRHSEIDNRDNLQELEANIFARDILAPACVLKEMGITSTEEIMKVCQISKTSAEIRAKRLQELKTRDKFYTSPLEKSVLKNFKNFIKNYGCDGNLK